MRTDERRTSKLLQFGHRVNMVYAMVMVGLVPLNTSDDPDATSMAAVEELASGPGLASAIGAYGGIQDSRRFAVDNGDGA